MAFFDSAVQRHLADIRQFVVLGAGFDTRAYRLPLDSPVRCFEIDTARTQAVKRATLERAGIDASRVMFVTADFGKDDWLDRLIGAGFDPTQRALLLWEGVTMYLTREAVQETLRKIASLAPGTVVAFDYFTTEPLVSRSLYWRYGRAATRAAHEPLRFGFDSTPPSKERLREFLDACGLSLVEHQLLGREAAGSRAWGGFATAAVK